MSAYNKPQSLGKVLQDLIKKMGIQHKLDEARVIETWAAMVGPQINGVTDSVWIKGKTLYVKINSAAWRQELHYRRQAWCASLNNQLGSDLVKEIVFR